MFSTLNEVKEFIKANDVKMIDFKMAAGAIYSPPSSGLPRTR